MLSDKDAVATVLSRDRPQPHPPKRKDHDDSNGCKRHACDRCARRQRDGERFPFVLPLTLTREHYAVDRR
jgi:hypothetical protein